MSKVKLGKIVFRRIGGRIIPFIRDKGGKSLSYSPELEKKYIGIANKLGRGSEKAYHAHHTLPVGKSVVHIDWHLRNLWDEGYKTVKEVTKGEHLESHVRLDKKFKDLIEYLKKVKK